ncbi:MAG: hypothetical protein ACPLPX_01200 [Candidatus Kapaibacteriota bacterium]
MDKYIPELIYELQNFAYPFTILSGTFGTGKSEIVLESINRLVNSQNELHIAIYFNLSNCHHFHQLPESLNVITNLKVANLIFEEISFFTKRYLNIIDFFNTEHPAYAKFFYDAYRFRDYFETDYLNDAPFLSLKEFSEKINSLLEKNIDKRILLRMFNVLSEALIYSLFQISQQNELKDKLKVAIVVDNYEQGSGIVDHWIVNHLYKTFEYKKFGDFESYEIAEDFKKFSPKDFFDFKFLLVTRHPYTFKKILNSEPEKKMRHLRIDMLSGEEFQRFIQQYNCTMPPQEIYSITFGIPFAIDYLCKNMNCQLNEDNKSIYFKAIFDKIAQGINTQLLETLRLLSVFDYFTLETVRCIPENYPIYEKIFKYLSDNNEITNRIENGVESYQINPHYKYFIYNNLLINEPKKYEHFISIFSKFQSGFEILNKFNYEERKIIRNLAYLKAFDTGETLRLFFQEDYPVVGKFVEENTRLFSSIDTDTYSLPDEIRNKILEFNQAVDNERYFQKVDFIKTVVKTKIEEVQAKVNEFKSRKEQIAERIKRIQYIKSKLNEEIQNIQRKIVSTENYLIDLNTKKYSTSGKFTWLPFTMLALASIIAFVIGNNILYIFSEAINEDSISGLGTAFKILSILLFGILLYVLIDHFGSKERKQLIQRAEEFIIEEEEKLHELKECLNLYKQTLKEYEEDLNNYLRETQKIDVEIEVFEKTAKILQLNAT